MYLGAYNLSAYEANRMTVYATDYRVEPETGYLALIQLTANITYNGESFQILRILFPLQRFCLIITLINYVAMKVHFLKDNIPVCSTCWLMITHANYFSPNDRLSIRVHQAGLFADRRRPRSRRRLGHFVRLGQVLIQ